MENKYINFGAGLFCKKNAILFLRVFLKKIFKRVN